MNPFDSQQNDETIAKLVIYSILIIDLAVVIFIAQAAYSFAQTLVGGL